jgi:hypothetical protein
MTYIQRMWNEKPLQTILIVAFILRLGSVIFSKGYGMHDDHFLVIESSKSWADGYDYNNWLPKEGEAEQHPSGHSFFYAGLHYFLFLFLKYIGITVAQSQMYVVRFIHALLSLLVVYCGYEITFKLSGEKQAKVVGLLLAVFWFMPFLSVRNLVEVVCIVPMIAATWVVVKNQDDDKLLTYVWAGILLGIAFSIRFQTILFTGGFGLAILFTKGIKQTIITALFFVAVAAGVQGITDFYIWGKPFVEFQEYVRYNIENANAYSTQPWYTYMLFISGVLIPPISLFLLFGYFKSWKKHLLLFLPSFIFLVFHSYFPNKQERFIVPIIPFIIVLGYIGWDSFFQNSTYWAKHQLLWKRFSTFFLVLNITALLVVSFAYSKRNRVESMTYLSAKTDFKGLVIEDSNRESFLMPPLFYLQHWITVYGVTQLTPADIFYQQYQAMDSLSRPNYVVFMQEDNIDQRVATLKKHFPTLAYEITVYPSYIDRLLHWLNPVNKNQTSYIYKIQ